MNTNMQAWRQTKELGYYDAPEHDHEKSDKPREGDGKRERPQRQGREQSALRDDQEKRPILNDSVLTEHKMKVTGGVLGDVSFDFSERDKREGSEVQLIEVKRQVPLAWFLKASVAASTSIDAHGILRSQARAGVSLGLPLTNLDAFSVFVEYDFEEGDLAVGVTMLNFEYSNAEAPRRAIETLQDWYDRGNAANTFHRGSPQWENEPFEFIGRRQ